MSDLNKLLLTFAGLLEAGAVALREYAEDKAAEPIAEVPAGSTAGDVVARARQLRPLLGPRQAEVLRQVEVAGDAGATTGPISRAMQYEQPNVYLTLQALARQGLVERDTSQHPHRYYLSPLLQPEEPQAAQD